MDRFRRWKRKFLQAEFRPGHEIDGKGLIAGCFPQFSWSPETTETNLKKGLRRGRSPSANGWMPEADLSDKRGQKYQLRTDIRIFAFSGCSSTKRAPDCGVRFMKD